MQQPDYDLNKIKFAIGDHGQLPPVGDNYSLMDKPNLRWCRGQDLNLQALAGTTTSRLHVCQFHHPGFY